MAETNVQEKDNWQLSCGTRDVDVGKGINQAA